MININKSKILLIGAPGSGKGTLSSILTSNYQLKHISTGDLFRSEVKNNGPYASQIKESMISGILISDEITNQVAINEILKLSNDGYGFILDGYPRTINQAEFLDKTCKIDKVFYLKINHQLLVKRVVGRRTCFNCGQNYNIYFSPPKQDGICDLCNTPLIQRKDDNEETLIYRIKEYETKTAPLINFYKQKNILVEIDANNSIEAVYQQILDGLNND